MKTATWTFGLALFLLLGLSAHGQALIEETFDYDVGALAGQNGGTGFSGAWTETISKPDATGSGATVTSGSIVFSDYATTGNKATLDIQTVGSFTVLSAIRPVGVSLSSGDLWYSYLYQRTDTAADNTSRAAEVRFNDGTIHLNTNAKRTALQGIRVRYDGSYGPDADDVSVQDGNAYLMIAKFADLNVANAQASFWAIDATGYDSIKAGGIDESELDSVALLKATDTAVTPEVLTAYLDTFSLINGTSSAAFTFDIDEFRLGSTLADVVPVSALTPGDANGDGMVNLADLQILGDNWQSTTATWSEADFTGDGNVNLADLQIIGDNWGYGASPDVAFGEALAGVVIPEPAAMTILGLALPLVLRRRYAR